MADNTERIQCLGGNVNHLVWLEAKWSRTKIVEYMQCGQGPFQGMKTNRLNSQSSGSKLTF